MSRAAKPACLARFTLDTVEHYGTISAAIGGVPAPVIALELNHSVIFTLNQYSFPIWQIVRFDRQTGETSTITNAQGSAMRPVLSPDGQALVYATRYETGTGLRVRDLATGAERWLIYPVTRDDQESRGTRDTFPGCAFKSADFFCLTR